MRSLGVLQRCCSYLQKTRIPYPKQVLTPLSFWHFADVGNITKDITFRETLFIKYTMWIEWLCLMSCTYRMGNTISKRPTEEGFGMLKQNFKIMYDTVQVETEEPIRFDNQLRHYKNTWNQKILRVYQIIWEIN